MIKVPLFYLSTINNYRLIMRMKYNIFCLYFLKKGENDEHSTRNYFKG